MPAPVRERGLRAIVDDGDRSGPRHCAAVGRLAALSFTIAPPGGSGDRGRCPPLKRCGVHETPYVISQRTGAWAPRIALPARGKTCSLNRVGNRGSTTCPRGRRVALESTPAVRRSLGGFETALRPLGDRRARAVCSRAGTPSARARRARSTCRVSLHCRSTRRR